MFYVLFCLWRMWLRDVTAYFNPHPDLRTLCHIGEPDDGGGDTV